MSEERELENEETAPRRRARRAAPPPDVESTVVRPRQDPDATIVTGRPEPEPAPAPKRRRRREREPALTRTARTAPPAPPAPQHTDAPWSRIAYGARSVPTTRSGGGPDAIQAAIGPPPQTGVQPPVPPRPQMPRLAKRFARARVVVLASYGAAILVSAIGLWVVARIAFG